MNRCNFLRMLGKVFRADSLVPLLPVETVAKAPISNDWHIALNGNIRYTGPCDVDNMVTVPEFWAWLKEQDDEVTPCLE